MLEKFNGQSKYNFTAQNMNITSGEIVILKPTKLINIKTGEIVEPSIDWMFDDRYSRFILEKKEDWQDITYCLGNVSEMNDPQIESGIDECRFCKYSKIYDNNENSIYPCSECKLDALEYYS